MNAKFIVPESEATRNWSQSLSVIFQVSKLNAASKLIRACAYGIDYRKNIVLVEPISRVINGDSCLDVDRFGRRPHYLDGVLVDIIVQKAVCWHGNYSIKSVFSYTKAG